MSTERPSERSFILHDIGGNIETVLAERSHHQCGVEGIVFYQQGTQLGLRFGAVLNPEFGPGTAHCHLAFPPDLASLPFAMVW
jgi:hypothetical protein